MSIREAGDIPAATIGKGHPRTQKKRMAYLQKNIIFTSDKCINTQYTCHNSGLQIMIKTIDHKGLQLFFENGNGARLPPGYLTRIAMILDMLDTVTAEDDIKELGMGVHRLTGDRAGFWSVKVSPNYRIIFRLYKGDIFDIDYVDYH
ncbi:MAG: type II toxin-antitoxin system RelE/ParE family toxin [Candidatus Pseudobacter hemicellulosilyticus]|uniref:Type II toxin-antitoxin system RelE/ParE family toxin n=1 Tax=Candidatus Pseudobacter hemicellulosilyticus TaxID=3121375 RepID=A0AAJ5WX94_9BACT|nr:MAG: type II toxin-antitoxin system RelE/ParE family toxin [Pseudobacter sp.]